MSGSQKISMKLRSFDAEVLQRAVGEIVATALRTGAEVRGPIPLPRKIRKFTVLRSPHINKKARDQFEQRSYSRLLEIVANPQTLDALMGLNLAADVEVEIRV